jgi:hypothetical protein
VVGVAPCLSTSALCIISGHTFGGNTSGGDQQDPCHLDPVALLHDKRLGECTTVAQPKTRCDPRLQTGPYLHSGEKHEGVGVN